MLPFIYLVLVIFGFSILGFLIDLTQYYLLLFRGYRIESFINKAVLNGDMGLDYFQLEDYLKGADEGKHDGFEHPTSGEDPIGKYKGGKRFISTSARTNGTTILTPEKQMYLLNRHDYISWEKNDAGDWVQARWLEQTPDGWLFNCIGDGLEYRTLLLDNGDEHTQNWWHTDYKQTREGQEGWRLPTTEEAIEMFYSLLLLSKDPRYHSQVRLILDGNQQENIPGLRQNIDRWPILADHIQYGRNLQARITNPYGKDETREIPYHSSGLVIAPQQHEGLLGAQKTPDEESWLEALAGSRWPLLPQILQFIAPRRQHNVSYSQQTTEPEPSSPQPHLREARIWTPSQRLRDNYSGRIASLDFFSIRIDLDFDVGGIRPAFGVRDVKKPENKHSWA